MSFLSVTEVIDWIGHQTSGPAPVQNRVAELRRNFLLQLRDALRESGSPGDPSRRRELSLVPLLFQEANYDDIDWTTRNASLGRLAELFAIDVAVQTGGRRREELTSDEYATYVAASFAAIDWRAKSGR